MAAACPGKRSSTPSNTACAAARSAATALAAASRAAAVASTSEGAALADAEEGEDEDKPPLLPRPGMRTSSSACRQIPASAAGSPTDQSSSWPTWLNLQ